MNISCVVAVAKNGVIGYQNDIPWYLPNDLKYFKKVTLHKPIIMGRKCFDSIGRPLPKRTNIILSRNPYYIVSNCFVAKSLTEALEMVHEEGAEEVCIIGGAQIYEMSMDLWDTLYYTEVDLEPEGDVFFPEIDWSNWKLVSADAHKADARNTCDYTFKVFKRISA